MPEAEVEEEEDLKQDENVLKEEEDQIYQINLKGGRGPIFTQEQEREIINMVLANNAIRLREIQPNIIGDNDHFQSCPSGLSVNTGAHPEKTSGSNETTSICTVFSFFFLIFF